MSDNLYHDHLDVCAECREKVMFTTCTEGPRLLKLQVTGVDPGPAPERPSIPATIELLAKLIVSKGRPAR